MSRKFKEDESLSMEAAVLRTEHAGLVEESKAFVTDPEKLLKEHESVVRSHDRLVEERKVVVAEREAILKEPDARLAERATGLNEFQALRSEQAAIFLEQEGYVAERAELLRKWESILSDHRRILAEREAFLKEHAVILVAHQALVTEGSVLRGEVNELRQQLLEARAETPPDVAELAALKRELELTRKALAQSEAGRNAEVRIIQQQIRMAARLQHELATANQRLQQVFDSKSWRITAPLRSTSRRILSILRLR